MIIKQIKKRIYEMLNKKIQLKNKLIKSYLNELDRRKEMRELVKIKCPTCWETVSYDIQGFSKEIECENCKQKIIVVIDYKTNEISTEKKINENESYPYMFYNENEPLEALNWINQLKKVIYFEFKQTGNLYFKIDYETLGLRDGNKITFNGEEFIIDNTPEEIKE